MSIFKNKGKENEHRFSKNDVYKMLTAESSFPVKEAYNAIRTNLLFTQQGEKCPVFVITSPSANNGKTINTVNLAISFAQMGKRTLVIDGDMRNPTIHRLFSIPVKNGLSEILAGLTDNIIVTKTDVDNLSVLTSGKVPPNPAELLSSPRMDKLLDFVREHYDCVFIDTPPINLVTDATIFSSKVTGYVVIVKADTTDMSELKLAVAALEHVESNIVGFVVNDATVSRNSYNYYYSRYGRKYSYNYNYNYK